MDDYKQFSAKTKNEAITKACIELGVTSSQLDIQVVSEGNTGFFGFGSKPAIIKVRRLEESTEDNEIEKIIDSVKIDAFKEDTRKESVKENKKPRQKNTQKSSQKPSEKAPEAKEEDPVKTEVKETVSAKIKTAEEINEAAAAAASSKEKAKKPSKAIEILTDPEVIKEVEESSRKFLTEVFSAMDLGEVQITSKYNTTDGSLEVDFEGEDMGILIGKRGQTLDSLQYLTSLVVNKGKSTYIRVKLDTEDYRRRRKETLENLARGIAYKVKKSRKPVVLEPMNPYERRIIHSALQGNKFVETMSEGEEPYRHVVVKLKR